jgi:hypothetical protein
MRQKVKARRMSAKCGPATGTGRRRSLAKGVVESRQLIFEQIFAHGAKVRFPDGIIFATVQTLCTVTFRDNGEDGDDGSGERWSERHAPVTRWDWD